MDFNDLTYKIVSYQTDPHFNMDEAVDWAIEMIELGHESENLFIIAGLSKPVSYFEGVSYVNKALNELNIKLRTVEDGILFLSLYYLKLLAKRKNIKNNLSILSNLIAYEPSDPLFDFRLLEWAWSDLDYGNEKQYYWPDATCDNIETIVATVAAKWLNKNPVAFRDNQ